MPLKVIVAIRYKIFSCINIAIKDPIASNQKNMITVFLEFFITQMFYDLHSSWGALIWLILIFFISGHKLILYDTKLNILIYILMSSENLEVLCFFVVCVKYFVFLSTNLPLTPSFSRGGKFPSLIKEGATCY